MTTTASLARTDRALTRKGLVAMTTTTLSGWTVAVAFKGTNDWQPVAGHATRPDAQTMRQYRQAYAPNRWVKLWPDAEFTRLFPGR